MERSYPDKVLLSNKDKQVVLARVRAQCPSHGTTRSRAQGRGEAEVGS